MDIKSELKLSNNIIDGLKNLGNSLNLDTSKKLIINTAKLILSDSSIPSNPEIYATAPDLAKQSEYALAQVLILSTKYNYSNERLQELLNSQNIPNPIVIEIIKIYEQNQKKLLTKLIQNGISSLHLTDINWKLQCDIKTVQNDKNELIYHLILNGYSQNTNDEKVITEFLCNTEELQTFLNHLKDIENQLHRIVKS